MPPPHASPVAHPPSGPAPSASDARPVAGDPPAADARRGSIGATFRAVAWSFFGVRGGRAHQADIARLNPVHVVIVGVVCAILFVLALVAVVHLVTA